MMAQYTRMSVRSSSFEICRALNEGMAVVAKVLLLFLVKNNKILCADCEKWFIKNFFPKCARNLNEIISKSVSAPFGTAW